MSDDQTSTLEGSATLGRMQPVRLLVVDGADRGATVTVSAGTATVGSQEGADLKLSDPSVSRRHLAVELLGRRVRVRDLSSKNGTRYLGARIDAVELPLGATVEVGNTRLAILPGVDARALSDKTQVGGLIGRSLAMRRLFALIEQLAPSDAAVLLHGETGTGKEQVARALHTLSPRASGPFAVLDCGTVQRELIQSSLFGHVKGAFTGAVKDQVGVLEVADGGVLFIDEVAELPLEMQPALLRVLETKTYQRVGDGRVHKSDFRIVAATHRDLATEVKAGRFRADLYYRLAAIVLEIPSLRDRLDDVPVLAEFFADEAGSPEPLSPGSLAALAAWQWPGNVRELKNAVERLVALGPASALPGQGENADEPHNFHTARESAIRAFEKSYLEALLKRHSGSASAAAREAGIARSYFYKLLDEHGLQRKK